MELVEESWNHDPLAVIIAKLNAYRRSIIQWTKEQNSKSNLLIIATQQDLKVALSSETPELPRIEALKATLLAAFREEEFFCNNEVDSSG